MPTEISSKEIYAMLYTGGMALEQQVAEIDALNVFPVPDGDTGTNMNLSFQSGIQEIEIKFSENAPIGQTMVTFARGIMMGARGNSGVILSQLFRGMSQAIKNKDTITAGDFALALEKGVEVAYKAVMKPVEGTILTVARESAKAAVRASKHDTSIEGVFRAAIDQAEITLSQTPDMLPVLKEVGVVDAGGKGLIVIYQGMFESLTGEQLSFKKATTAKQSQNITDISGSEEYGYCTEFLIQGLVQDVSEDALKDSLAKLGESLVVILDEDFIKIHIHTLDPGQVLTHCLQFGSLHRIKIDNMTEQHQHTNAKQEVQQENLHEGHIAKSIVKKPYGIVSVTNGEGIRDVFQSLGADQIVFGGQSMNPSTEDLAKAVDQIHADTIIILPNNKNIILAAEQVNVIIEDKEIVVVPTKTIPEGIAALLSFHEDQSINDNIDVMKEAMKDIVSGQVTYAIRDTQMNGTVIKEGDILGILGSEIVVTGNDLVRTTTDLLGKMVDPSVHEIITIFTGKDVEQKQIDLLQEIIESKYDDFDIEIKNGMQPTYYFIISVE